MKIYKESYMSKVLVPLANGFEEIEAIKSELVQEFGEDSGSCELGPR